VDVELRPATGDDGDFFFHLHRESLGPYVDEVWGWDDEDQRGYLTRNLVLKRVRVIVVGGSDVGRLDVDDGDDEIFLVLIELLRSHQGHGIGSRLIGDLVDGARAQGKRLRLNVLEVNDGAHRLYRRLGFTELGRDVDGPAVKIRMIGP
jgi:GNAT superfamily N-acetyltransferase